MKFFFKNPTICCGFRHDGFFLKENVGIHKEKSPPPCRKDTPFSPVTAKPEISFKNAGITMFCQGLSLPLFFLPGDDLLFYDPEHAQQFGETLIQNLKGHDREGDE